LLFYLRIMLTTTDSPYKQLTTVLKKMSREEQKMLLMQLNRKEILQRARAIDAGTRKNRVSMKQVVEVVNRNRKKDATR